MTDSEKLDSLMQDMAVIKDKVLSHHKTLYGNGRKGLVARLVPIEQFCTRAMWFFAISIVAGVSVVSKLAYDVIRHAVN